MLKKDLVEKGYGGDEQKESYTTTCSCLAMLLATTNPPRAIDFYKESCGLKKELIEKNYGGDKLREGHSVICANFAILFYRMEDFENAYAMSSEAGFYMPATSPDMAKAIQTISALLPPHRRYTLETQKLLEIGARESEAGRRLQCFWEAFEAADALMALPEGKTEEARALFKEAGVLALGAANAVGDAARAARVSNRMVEVMTRGAV